MLMIYPEQREISDDEIVAWAVDRAIDNEVDIERMRANRDLTDEEYERIRKARMRELPTLEEAIERLQDDGVATFRRSVGNRLPNQRRGIRVVK